MAKQRPTKIALDRDEFHAQYVGRLADGRQFFITFPGDHRTGREFVVLYLFDRAGVLIEARIENRGQRFSAEWARADRLPAEWMASLGEIKHGRIEVAPFEVVRDGLAFGFIAHPPWEAGGEWQVTVEPGNIMAFRPPWDSGIYDT